MNGSAAGPGRPSGKRNYLAECVLQALGDDFAVHGPAIIAEVRRTKPTVYLQCCVSLLPKQLQVERSSPLGDISDEELGQLEQLLAALRAKPVLELSDNSPLLPVEQTNSE